MIDFKELPKDGIKFEQLIRELFIREGFETHWTGTGADGGRDLVVTEKLTGTLSTHERKWLISCKHFANTGRSVGREQLGNIIDDCKAINAEGYILACSTQPTASLVTRLEEIRRNKNIQAKFWDAIEIEKRLLQPNTFSLIHTFFPVSAQNYQWKIYNAYSPSFWAANYKNYFFYMSSRDAHTFPYLESIEAIVTVFEKIKLYKGKGYGDDSHFLRLRAVYYDDKHCTHTVFLDYLYPSGDKENKIMKPDILYEKLLKAFTKKEHAVMNAPSWDVKYVAANMGSDHFHSDHKNYYKPYLENFENGSSRGEFLHDLVFQYKQIKTIEKLKKEIQ